MHAVNTLTVHGDKVWIEIACSSSLLSNTVLLLPLQRCSSPSTPSGILSPVGHGPGDGQLQWEERQGQWLRRRRLDGAINRVPVGFYQKVWKILQKCHGLSIDGYVLPSSTTREVPPCVWACTGVSLSCDSDSRPGLLFWRWPLERSSLLCRWSRFLTMSLSQSTASCWWRPWWFLAWWPTSTWTASAASSKWTASCIWPTSSSSPTRYCCSAPLLMWNHCQCSLCSHLTCIPQKSFSACDYFLEKDPATGICNFFFDSAPSGSYGTMTYLSKATVTYVQDFLPSSSCLMQWKKIMKNQ